MTFAPSETPGKYEFLGVIDKPKAGVTYKVRNRETGEIESLRALPGAASSHPETLERFLREIKIHTRLSHPNILAFHDVFELDGQLVMTAEYVEGTTLAALCREGPVLSSEAVRIVGEVLSGLEEAHELGIVHRGITAEHVIVTPTGEVKLGGFGLAKPADDMNLTQSGSVLGEPRYISPEQVMGTAALDARSDLYSVGVLLYHALTGKVPFDNPNEFDVMVAQVNSVPRPPSVLNPGISPELDRVVLTALAKKPEERYPTAAEFRQALNSTVAVPSPEPVEEPAAEECAPPQFFVEPRSTPSPTKAFALGLLSVAVGLAVLYFAMH